MKVGVEPRGGSPQDLASLIADEVEAWKDGSEIGGDRAGVNRSDHHTNHATRLDGEQKQ